MVQQDAFSPAKLKGIPLGGRNSRLCLQKSQLCVWKQCLEERLQGHGDNLSRWALTVVIPWGKRKKKGIIFRAAKRVGNNSWDRESTVLGKGCAESRHAGKSNGKKSSETPRDGWSYLEIKFTSKLDLSSLRLETTGHRLREMVDSPLSRAFELLL